jgi:hypothetical protein
VLVLLAQVLALEEGRGQLATLVGDARELLERLLQVALDRGLVELRQGQRARPSARPASP